MTAPTAWFWLVVAGLLEILWAAALKMSDGFSRPMPSAVGIAAAAASFFLLSLALRSLPVGTGYAVWVGIGVVGTAAVGIVALGEPAGVLRLGSLALILAGVVGLRLAEG